MKRNSKIKTMYYMARPLIPRRAQLAMRRKLIEYQKGEFAESWPILKSAAKPPMGWRGWPEGKQFAVVLTHDVELKRGHDRCRKLIALEEELGFCSSFNFVPERYDVSPNLRAEIQEKGFEVGVHGLNHDGKLYSSKKVFRNRAQRINHYIADWGVVGFRSPAMHHNLDWIRMLNIQYDCSTFDTDPFEPQSDGVGTIFPFWVESSQGFDGYVEMPYTLAQDFTLFVLMQEPTIRIWEKKIDWIAQNGGMVLINTHPDYMRFGSEKPGIEEYYVDRYTDVLEYLNQRYRDDFWHVLPKDMAQYWSEHVESDKNTSDVGFTL